MSSILVSPYKSARILHGDYCCSLWLAETFCKKIHAWLHVLPLHQNHLYTDRPPLPLWSSFSELPECCLPGRSPHFAPSKTQLASLVLCIPFKSAPWYVINPTKYSHYFVLINTLLNKFSIIWLEKEMAIHSSILARRIPWIEEYGGLKSMRSRRIRHDWSD